MHKKPMKNGPLFYIVHCLFLLTMYVVYDTMYMVKRCSTKQITKNLKGHTAGKEQKMYDYRKAVYENVVEAIKERFTDEELKAAIQEDRENLVETLNEELWIDDSVTGNASGSYTFNTYRAEENLLHNWDLIEETAAEFGIEPKISSGYEFGPEYWDVSIRCYLLAESIEKAIEDLEAEEETA